MPALVAVHFNPDLKAKSESLTAVGKAPKLRLSIVSRKLLSTAIALLRDGRARVSKPT